MQLYVSPRRSGCWIRDVPWFSAMMPAKPLWKGRTGGRRRTRGGFMGGGDVDGRRVRGDGRRHGRQAAVTTWGVVGWLRLGTMIFRCRRTADTRCGNAADGDGIRGRGMGSRNETGFDSNVAGRSRVERATRCLLAYAGFNRGPSGESRGDWVFSALAGGAAFAERFGSGLYGDHALPGIGLLPSRGLDGHRRTDPPGENRQGLRPDPPWPSAARSKYAGAVGRENLSGGALRLSGQPGDIRYLLSRTVRWGLFPG